MTDALSQGAADQSHYRRHLEECLARLEEELATWESVRMAMAERIGEAEEQNREMRDLLRRITEQTLWPSLASAIYEAHAWLAAHPEPAGEEHANG